MQSMGTWMFDHLSGGWSKCAGSAEGYLLIMDVLGMMERASLCPFLFCYLRF